MNGLMQASQLLIPSILEHVRTNYPDALITSREAGEGVHRSTYLETAERISRLMGALRSLGVEPGARVATLAWNDSRHFELYYAISSIEAICHTINPRLSLADIDYIVEDADDQFLFVAPQFFDIARHLCQSRAFKAVVLLQEPSSEKPDGLSAALWYEELVAAHEPDRQIRFFDENTASALCYTSGTTGRPKGVLYSHRSTVLHALVSSHNFGFCFAPGLKVMPVVPMFHVNAWNTPYSAPLCGANLVLPGASPTPQQLARLVAEEDVNTVIAVPTVLHTLLDALRALPAFPKSLTRVITGGTAPSEALIRDYETLGVSVLHGAGMTETSSMLAMNHLTREEELASVTVRARMKTSQGKPPFGLGMRLVNDEGDVLPHDAHSPGHLELRGPWVVDQYFGGLDACTADGWFRTGDVATITRDGRLNIVDRSKDLIKSGGEWISSIELENAAAAVAGVKYAAAIAVTHVRWGERPLLVVEPIADAPALKNRVLEELSRRFPKWWLPDEVLFVDAMPLMGTGKIAKAALRDRFKNVYSEPIASSH